MSLTHIGPKFYGAQKGYIGSKWVSQPYISVTRCVMLIASFPLLYIVLAGMFTREETSNMELQIFVDLPPYSGFAFP